MATPPRSPAGTAGFPDVPGIDRRRAEQRLAGNRRLFLHGLRELRDEFAEVVDRTREDLARDDREAAAARLHKLRGVAGNLSAEELAALAADLERGLREAQRPPSERALVRLETALRRLLAGLPAEVDPPAPQAAPAAPLDTAAVGALITALAQHDMLAIERFEALRPGLAARHGGDEVARLGEAIDGLQFGIAEARLRAWYGPRGDGSQQG